MKDLVIVHEFCKQLGYNIDSLTLNEAISLKKEIIDSIEQSIISSDNKQGLEDTHEKIRNILINHGNKEHGDCIVDEICEVVGVLPTTAYYKE